MVTRREQVVCLYFMNAISREGKDFKVVWDGDGFKNNVNEQDTVYQVKPARKRQISRNVMYQSCQNKKGMKRNIDFFVKNLF